MITLDIFNQDAFSAVELTDFVNKKPHIPTMLRDLNIFEIEGVRTRTIWVEVKDGEIALIPTSNIGEPLYQNEKQKREAIPLSTLRLAKGDNIMATELQDIRAEGEAETLKEVQSEINLRLDQTLGDFDLTEENLMLGAIQGIVVDADGSTVLYSLFDKFGITQSAEIDFDLDNASPDSGALKKLCNQVIRSMARAGKGAFTNQTEIMAFCGDDFWDDFVSHTEVQGAYNNWMNAQSMSNDIQVFKPFRWGGITWVNYRGTDDASTVTIGTDKVKFFPKNARGVMKFAYAPAEFLPFVNSKGLPRYNMIITDKEREAWVKPEVYSYPLPYCTRPEMLLRGKRT